MRFHWPFKKLDIPNVVKNGQSNSEEALRESEQKLRDAVRAQQEVRKVSSKSKELARLDNFAIALERAMRRSNG